MTNQNFTISKEELKQLIEDAVFKATCTEPNLEYNIITKKRTVKTTKHYKGNPTQIPKARKDTF